MSLKIWKLKRFFPEFLWILYQKPFYCLLRKKIKNRHSSASFVHLPLFSLSVARFFLYTILPRKKKLPADNLHRRKYLMQNKYLLSISFILVENQINITISRSSSLLRKKVFSRRKGATCNPEKRVFFLLFAKII